LLIIIHFQKLLVTLLPQTLKIKAKQEVWQWGMVSNFQEKRKLRSIVFTDITVLLK
jgi:hypothetical protein